jgi:hypothetical protein
MRFIAALAVGVASGVAAIFLHHFAPPFGIVIAIAGTFTAIWSVGRMYGKRFYKIVAAATWLAIFWRGASLGVGNEIFIQGDRLGNVFLLSSVIALIFAIALPAN